MPATLNITPVDLSDTGIKEEIEEAREALNEILEDEDE